MTQSGGRGGSQKPNEGITKVQRIYNSQNTLTHAESTTATVSNFTKKQTYFDLRSVLVATNKIGVFGMYRLNSGTQYSLTFKNDDRLEMSKHRKKTSVAG